MPEGPVRVLLVEDDEDDYLLTKELFGELPPGAYHLDRVPDFDSALRAIDECQHDVFLIDYRLGRHTGLELMGLAGRRDCKAPMIMLTGQREREVDLQAMRAGAVDYLVKDRLDAATLERSMRYALQQKRHEEAIRQANQLLEQRVHERTAELAELNETLKGEIAERKRAEELLLQVDRRKDEFLATLAHELRNPLSPLSAAAELIGLEPENSSQVRELAIVMARQMEQLVRLIDDLLDVSRISLGKLRLRREPMALGEAIAAALDVSRPRIDSASHSLHVSITAEPLIVDGDKIRLSEVVANLLINAAKYTPTGGAIELAVSRDGQDAVIRVRDNGIGIPAEMLSQIFDLFAQVDSSPTRSHGGLGIGLTLVKTLVEMHGGSVRAASSGGGRGSEFTVRLPLADPGRLAPRMAEPASSSGEPVPGLKLLVVDDNQSASHLLSRLLQKLGQQVRVEHSASAAFGAVTEFQPDVIISDIAMPGMTGYELAQQIRALTTIRQPFLIALTGYGQDSDRQEALAAGFDQHLTKPIGLPLLERLLEELGRDLPAKARP